MTGRRYDDGTVISGSTQLLAVQVCHGVARRHHITAEQLRPWTVGCPVVNRHVEVITQLSSYYPARAYGP